MSSSESQMATHCTVGLCSITSCNWWTIPKCAWYWWLWWLSANQPLLKYATYISLSWQSGRTWGPLWPGTFTADCPHHTASNTSCTILFQWLLYPPPSMCRRLINKSACTLTINSIPSPQGWYPSNLKQILNGYCQALGARRLCLNSGRSSVRSPLHLHPAQPDKSPPPRNKMNSEL